MRQLLGWGALAGLVFGAVMQLFVHEFGGTSGIVPLVRISFLFPALVFGVWWVLSPELTRDVDATPAAVVVDPQERLREIASTFDTTAVPQARSRDLSGASIEDRARFRSSIGITGNAEGADPSAFGVPRPARTFRREA